MAKIEELKARAFDLIQQKQDINNELGEVYQQIQESSKE